MLKIKRNENLNITENINIIDIRKLSRVDNVYMITHFGNDIFNITYNSEEIIPLLNEYFKPQYTKLEFHLCPLFIDIINRNDDDGITFTMRIYYSQIYLTNDYLYIFENNIDKQNIIRQEKIDRFLIND